MRLVCLLLAAASLSACAASAPVAVAPPPPRPAERPAAPRPPPPPEEQAPVVPPEPPAPVQAPRGTVRTRAFYEQSDVSEWTLATGTTVVFKPTTTAGFVTVAFSTAPVAGRQIDALDPDLRTALERIAAAPGLDLATLTVVVVGAAAAADVELMAARAFVTDRATLTPPSADTDAYTAPASPALGALVGVLWARTGRAVYAVRVDDTVTLRGAPGAAALVALAPTDAEAAAAGTAARLAEALADLYRATGDPRPSADPASAVTRARRAPVVSARDVAGLAARFAASPLP